MAENKAAMADDIDEMESADGQAPEAKKKGGKLWLWIFLLLLILGGGGGAAWYFTQAPAVDESTEEGVPAATHNEPHYLQLDPGFVVNLNDPDLMRYLQVDVQLMADDTGVLNDVEKHMPEVRNRLLLLLAQQKFETLIPREGKEALQTTALNEVNAVLREKGVTESVDSLYFTSFVMQ